MGSFCVPTLTFALMVVLLILALILGLLVMNKLIEDENPASKERKG